MNEVEEIEKEIGEIAEALSVEEIANTITHGFGLALAFAGLVFLLVMSVTNGNALYIAASAIYGTSMVLLYAASTCYHGARSVEVKKALHFADYAGIYLLIAGTYTPFVLVTFNGSAFGWTLFATVWTFAITFIILRAIIGNRYRALWVVSFLLMGWMGVVAIGPLLTLIGWGAVALILAGGAAYSIGVIFFAAHRIPHNHAIWHVFVMAGSILHYIAVVVYVRPGA